MLKCFGGQIFLGGQIKRMSFIHHPYVVKLFWAGKFFKWLKCFRGLNFLGGQIKIMSFIHHPYVVKLFLAGKFFKWLKCFHVQFFWGGQIFWLAKFLISLGWSGWL